MGNCKDCRDFIPCKAGVYGACNCSKFLDEHPDYLGDEAANSLCYGGDDDCKAYIYVGVNFGCIYFRERGL